MRPSTLIAVIAVVVSSPLAAQHWLQWGADGLHHGNVPFAGQRLQRIETEMLLDPFIDAKKAAGGGNLLTHYPVPLVDRNEVVVVVRSGQYTSFQTPETQIWNVTMLRRSGDQLNTAWSYASDWKPVPMNAPGAPFWEPVYHAAMTADAVWAPGRGGTIDKLRRSDGSLVFRINPLGSAVDELSFVTGPPTVDDNGNVYYNVIRLDPANPWTADVSNAWLVKVSADGRATVATFASLTPNAPPSSALCTTQFGTSSLPWPPSPEAVAPGAPCGAQRPGINVAPAVARDGTVYTVSRTHFNDRWGFLVAANPDLTPKWAASLRNRFTDGCNVLVPPNGTPGGCRVGSPTGVDPADNQAGSGRVPDTSTSSPVVAPDGNILFGALTRYNYAQGHLMMFSPAGQYLRSYPFGWDMTPSIYEHDGTYSIVFKENRYGVSSYCNNPTFCPSNRTVVTPQDPEQYLITQVDPQLRVEWQFRNTETQSCLRLQSGEVRCIDDSRHANGFEFCVNAIAVDGNGIVYANAEDGYLYAINQSGKLRERLFLRLALGAAYTPLSIGHDGRIYTQNDARLFVVGEDPNPIPRRRAVRRQP